MSNELNNIPEVNADTPAQVTAPAAVTEPKASGIPNWAFVTGVILTCLVIVWFMARAEIVSRAQERYEIGEMYYSWIKDPAKKKSYYDAQLMAKEIDKLDHRRFMEDSAIKNAFVEYETVIDLFQPPRSEWVLKSEERMKEIKPMYVKFLADLGIEYIE